MTLALGACPVVDSPLHRLDARWKLASLMVAIAATAALQRTPTAGVTLIGAVGLLVLSRLPWSWCRPRVLTTLVVLGPVLVGLLILTGGPTVQMGPLAVSCAGSTAALLLGFKVTAITLLVLVITATASPTATLKAAHKLFVPGLLLQLVQLSVRYVSVLGDELARIRLAVRVRGFRNRLNRHSVRTAGHVAGTLLVRGAERGERVAQAMRCRGFANEYRLLTEFRTRPRDLVFAVLVLTAATSVTLVDRFGLP